MKSPDRDPRLTLFALALATILYRAFAAQSPGLLANFSPMLAFTLVASVYAARLGFLYGPAVFLLSEFLFLDWNRATGGSVFSIWMVIGTGFYLACSLLMTWASSQKPSLVRCILGSALASFLFYLLGNTTAWWENPSYPQTWSGWLQANTTGLPGYLPSWVFLKNGLIGDVGFALLFFAVLECVPRFHRSSPLKTVLAA